MTRSPFHPLPTNGLSARFIGEGFTGPLPADTGHEPPEPSAGIWSGRRIEGGTAPEHWLAHSSYVAYPAATLRPSGALGVPAGMGYAVVLTPVSEVEVTAVVPTAVVGFGTVVEEDLGVLADAVDCAALACTDVECLEDPQAATPSASTTAAVVR